MARLLAGLLVLILATCAQAQTPGVWFLPTQAGERGLTPRAFTRDGQTLVGWVGYTSDRGDDAFSWTREAGRQVSLDAPPLITAPFAVSADGAITAGSWSDRTVGFSERPFRQVGDGAPELIQPPAGFIKGRASGMSDDGGVLAGNWETGAPARVQPFVWTPSGGTVLLGELSYVAQTSALSRNGTTVVGRASFGGGVGFVWREETGFQVLQPPPLLGISWGARAVSTDGSIIAGYYSTGSGVGLIRWVQDVPQDLGVGLTPVSVSDDGSVIAGNSNLTPTVWSEQFGFRGVADYFQLNGLALPSGLTMYQLTTMSPDGRTFAGYATLNGVGGAYVITVPAPSSTGVLFTSLGWALLQRRRLRPGPRCGCGGYARLPHRL